MYRKKGPNKTTQILLNYLKTEGVKDLTLLDIGGGIGAIQHELLKEGISNVINVEASTAYLETAKVEAERQGQIAKITFHHGNFVELAAEIPKVDVVTLERVICCFPDMKELVTSSAQKATKYYGLIYPRNNWWVKFGFHVINFFVRFNPKKSVFRSFIHSRSSVHKVLQQNNFELNFHQKTGVWHVEVFKLTAPIN